MLALLYDVHGNLPALEAVLADARASGAQRHLVGGDVALFGGWPAECVIALRELDDATWIRGNGERWTADPGGAPDGDPVQGAVAAAWEALGEPVVADLARLSESARVAEGIRAWHGSPVSDVRSFWPQPADDEDDLLDGVTDRCLVFGHTHLPFARTAAGGVRLINPGSVGMPLDGDTRAAYALLDDDGAVEHRRVEYDHASAVQRLRDRYGDEPWITTPLERLEHARMETP